MKIWRLPAAFAFFLFSIHAALSADSLDPARSNGLQAQEALVRSKRVMDAWMKRVDPVTGLLPRRGDQETWYVRDSGADLYPFLVMAAYYTDRPLFENGMLALLRNEVLRSTRLGMISDNILPGAGGFEFKDLDLDRVIFGTAEYAKDGLLPLTELLGRHGWCERMAGIADDLILHAPCQTRFGKLPAVDAEVNGDLLQVFSRLAFMTHDPRYINQAIRIADFYFHEVIPKCNGIPCHIWNDQDAKPELDRFSFADHGNEIAGGLSELVMFLKESGHPRFQEFRQPLMDLIDTLLACGLNEDGVWFGSIEPTTRKILDPRPAHCWGYLFNAVYTTYLITGEERLLAAVKRALESVANKPTYLDDPAGSGRNYGSNAYSDALESAIVFLNRLPSQQLDEAIDGCFPRFLARQREDGIIEDWYGDGNYVRTALMYALMKSQGTWTEPWREDLLLGAVREEGRLSLVLEAASPWQGRVRFDVARHRKHLNLTVNYTRLNEFPEWFTVKEDRLYEVEANGGRQVLLGGELVRGIEVNLEAAKPVVIHVEPREGPPYGR
jgi:hypothetical protein